MVTEKKENQIKSATVKFEIVQMSAIKRNKETRKLTGLQAC